MYVYIYIYIYIHEYTQNILQRTYKCVGPGRAPLTEERGSPASVQ